MLTISKQQTEAFAQDRLRRVCRKLADRLLARNPEACEGRRAEEIAAALEPDVSFAHEQGFRSMRMLERYTDICATLGLGFGEREEWVGDILSRRDMSPVSKLDRIEETSVFVLMGRSR